MKREAKLPDDDEIEIIEVVGLDDEDAPPAAAEPPTPSVGDSEVDATEVVLDLDAEETAAGDAPGAAPADREQLLRLRADFENFQKRMAREREAHQRHAAAGLVTRLLPVLDNFERALNVARQAGTDPAFQEGVALIFRQLLDELRKEGLTAVDSVGEPFDPEVHEAVATTPESGLPAHTVIEELQRGYRLHDRLLRPALVRVSVGGTGEAEPSEIGED